jgi:NADH:ubiquinone oxidoreductase subunit 5 (subunit L)/multisubunit Na+/H+ antiporter MnhA subunit
MVLRLLLIPLLGSIVFMLTRNAIEEHPHRILNYVGASTTLVMIVLVYFSMIHDDRVRQGFAGLGITDAP